MAKVKKVRVVYDPEDNILDVWFDEPGKEVMCTEMEEDVVLRKDRKGRVIGFEMFNFLSEALRRARTRVEVAAR